MDWGWIGVRCGCGEVGCRVGRWGAEVGEGIDSSLAPPVEANGCSLIVACLVVAPRRPLLTG